MADIDRLLDAVTLAPERCTFVDLGAGMGRVVLHAARRPFRQIVGVTGLVVTKLDGTAKGGVIFALAREFGLPIRFVGLGETATDLRTFDAEAFVDGLLPASLGRDERNHD